MQKEFERRITLMNPTFEIKEKLTSDTIFSFLNAYTKRYVKQIYLQADQTQDKSRAQKKSIDSIKSLISRTIINKSNIIDNERCNVSFKLPTDYFLYIRSNSFVSSTYRDPKLKNLEPVPNELIDIEDADKVITTPYNSIILRNPQVVMQSDDSQVYMNVIHDRHTNIECVELVYYRMPKEFNVIGVDNKNVLNCCELPESTHMEIVEGAVEMFITEAKYRLNIKPEDTKKQ